MIHPVEFDPDDTGTDCPGAVATSWPAGEVLADLLARLRSDAGLSILEVGKAIGRTRATWRGWEEGLSIPPRPEDLLPTARAFRVPHAQLADARLNSLRRRQSAARQALGPRE